MKEVAIEAEYFGLDELFEELKSDEGSSQVLIYAYTSEGHDLFALKLDGKKKVFLMDMAERTTDTLGDIVANLR